MKYTIFNPAFVFNCHFNGLSVIQAMGRQGVKVYALDSTRSIGTWSRYAQFQRCPDPLTNEKGFIDFLMDTGQSFPEKPVLFPTNDHWATAISKNKKKLQQYYIPCVSDWKTVELIINKDRFCLWAMEHGYPVPKQYGNNEPGINAFPLVAKPRYRRISNMSNDITGLSEALDNHRLIILNNRDEYFRYISKNKEIIPYIIFQEYIPGMADCMHTVGIYANKSSEVLGVFTGRKVRGFPPDIGDCIVGQSEILPPLVIEMVKRIVKDLSYHGIAEFEFKKNPQNGEYKLIEINPRSWSWIGITPACGVNLPWIAYNDLTGTEKAVYYESKEDNGAVKYIKLFEDIRNCFYLNKKTGFPQYQMSLRQWWKSIRAEKQIFAGFSWDDPLPGFYQVLTQIVQIVIASLHKMADPFKLNLTRQRNE